MPIYHAVKYYTCVLVSCSMHRTGESTGEHVHRQNFDPTICSSSARTAAYLTSTDLLRFQLQPNDTEVVEGCTVRKYCKLTFTTRILLFFFKKIVDKMFCTQISPQMCSLKHPEVCTVYQLCLRFSDWFVTKKKKVRFHFFISTKNKFHKVNKPIGLLQKQM